jgi:hypothetical protein
VGLGFGDPYALGDDAVGVAVASLPVPGMPVTWPFTGITAGAVGALTSM